MSARARGDDLPRLLAGLPAYGAMTLPDHLDLHGPAPLGRSSAGLIDGVHRAGLGGRGGSGFPTAFKLGAVARATAQARHASVVVANAAEGEPASLKDHLLLEAVPHLVLDGALLAAEAVGADEVVVCTSSSARAARDSVAGALRERPRPDADRIRLHTLPERFVAGQETALISHVNGGLALPKLVPPLPDERGVKRRPTLVNNVETLAQLALIARHGADWFRQLGVRDQPGSALVTLSGAVAHPGVYEIELGASLSGLIDAAGGATDTIGALLLGGYFGTWLPGELAASIFLAQDDLVPHGAGLGSGVIVVLGSAACGVAETGRVARWLSDQSAGQCGPCVHGLDAIASAIEGLVRGSAPPETQARIARWATLVKGRGACAHPDGAVRFVSSALAVFASDFADHARHGPCPSCERARELPLVRAAVPSAAAA